MSPLVQLKGVGLRLGRTSVLSDIDWQWKPEERWAIVGNNGAGKTCLLKLIGGQYWPNTGSRIYDFGFGPETDAVLSLQRIQLVSHELEDRYERFGWNFSTLTVVLTGIWSMTIPRRTPTPQELILGRACLTKLGLLHHIGRPFLSLSRGERRRVLLARALAAQPKALLLDESRAGLDPLQSAHWEKLLAGLSTALPIIVTEHPGRALPKWVTHVLHLKEGCIAFEGTANRWTPSETVASDGQPRPIRPSEGTQEPLVRIQRANVWLDETHALRDFDWTIKPQQQWLVTGPNGSGKSTLLRLLHGQLRPARGGEIHWHNFESRSSIWSLRRRIAWAAPALETDYRFPDSVMDCICSGFASTVGLIRHPTPTQRERAKELATLFDVHAFLERKISSLSYGQRRRAMIARAMVNRPSLLLLDEPSEGLDLASARQLASILSKVIDEESCQLVCASHLEWGHGLFTHQLILERGRLVGAQPLNT